jgi:hypothetical protein
MKQHLSSVLVSACSACLFSGVLIGVILGKQTAGTNTKNPSATSSSTSTYPDMILVRNYLKENLPDGKFEEIKWSPSMNFQGYYFWNEKYADGRKRIYVKESTLGSAGTFDYAPYCWEYNDRPGSAISLKFRYKNQLGGNSVDHWTFIILDRKVVLPIDLIDFRTKEETFVEWCGRTGYADSVSAKHAIAEGKARKEVVNGLQQFIEDKDTTKSIKVPKPLGDEHRLLMH